MCFCTLVYYLMHGSCYFNCAYHNLFLQVHDLLVSVVKLGEITGTSFPSPSIKISLHPGAFNFKGIGGWVLVCFAIFIFCSP